MTGPGWLVDLTRSTSRLGRGALTGIDRVERAWALHLCAGPGPGPVLGLVRSRLGYLLLDAAGIAAVVGRLGGGALQDRPDWLARIGHFRQPAAAAGESFARRHSIARSWRPGLRAMLCRHLPEGGIYLNLGHSNLTGRGLADLAGAGLRRAVMLHDVIALDHPEWSRPAAVAGFRRKIRAVAGGADHVIHLTAAMRARSEARLAECGRVPPGILAPLGVDRVAADRGFALPGRRYFLALGTLEPRKNLTLLLDVWDRLSRQAAPPLLVLAGGAGWESAAVLQRIDRMQRAGHLCHFPDLGDAQVAALIEGAQALLFPSRAEGFGLPPVEAALAGTPVIASDIPVLREVLGNYAIYLDPTDIYSWMETVEWYNRRDDGQSRRMGDPPRLGVSARWDDHFSAVLSKLG